LGAIFVENLITGFIVSAGFFLVIDNLWVQCNKVLSDNMDCFVNSLKKILPHKSKENITVTIESVFQHASHKSIINV